MRHDPVKFLTDLSSKLASRSRHVCVFLGAGSSKACGLPDVITLQAKILAELTGDHRAHFERQLKTGNLESALSRLRRIAALVGLTDTVDGLNSDSATTLDEEICSLIIKHLTLVDAKLEPAYDFAAWVSRSRYERPIELFTVNYDLVIETALEHHAVPYFDGFVGALAGRFRRDLVEATSDERDAWLPSFVTRVWKLHGSTNWAWVQRGSSLRDVVRTSQPGDLPAAIYPSDVKYEESRRVPFVVLQDRLRRALREPETLMLVSGYSWSDDHLNELFFDAAAQRPRSEIIAFCYSDLPAILKEHALRTPNLQVVTPTTAVIGGTEAVWVTPDPTPDLWAGKLGDFSHLARFLSRTAVRGDDA